MQRSELVALPLINVKLDEFVNWLKQRQDGCSFYDGWRHESNGARWYEVLIHRLDAATLANEHGCPLSADTMQDVCDYAMKHGTWVGADPRVAGNYYEGFDFFLHQLGDLLEVKLRVTKEWRRFLGEYVPALLGEIASYWPATKEKIDEYLRGLGVEETGAEPKQAASGGDKQERLQDSERWPWVQDTVAKFREYRRQGLTPNQAANKLKYPDGRKIPRTTLLDWCKRVPEKRADDLTS